MVQSKENYVADPKWYDFEVKEKYLESISDSQKTYATFLMKKMSEHEEFLDEPLYDQTTPNIESFLFSLAPLTNKTSYKGIGYVVRYMRFAVELGVKKSNIILIENSPKYADKFVPRNARIFVTLAQLDSIVNNCENHQDKVIFRLLFEGLRGDKLSEPRNLKPNEVYEKQLDGRIQYFIDINSSDKNNRTVRITENLYQLCKNAENQETYLLNNGREVNENVAHRRGEGQNLIDSGYVLKRSKIGRNAGDEEASISYHGLYLRVKRIMDYEEFKGIDADYMKFGNLYQSGALYEAYQLIDLEYAEGLLGACTKEEREAVYSRVNWLSIRRKVCEKFIYIHDQKSKELISMDNMIKYY